MKIIKKGKLPELEVYRATCYICKTVFEYQASEGEYFSNQRDGTGYVVNCPLCHKEVYHYPKALNKPVDTNR